MGSGEPPVKEGVRQLVELATSCGRKHQSEQTSFVHHCYTKEDEKDSGTIPVYENLLFALALMRSKSADTVQEGKALVEKILPFQNHVEEVGKGGFPIYLHEYPHCKDRLLGIRLLPVFYAILSQFHHVIGNGLKTRMIEASRALLHQSLHVNQEKQAPYSLAFTLGIAAQALGKFVDLPAAVDEGRAIMGQLPPPDADISLYSPIFLSDLLIAFQMADEVALPPSWNDFWAYLSNTWHRPSCSYCGPGMREYQYGEEPLATLYDLFMGFATGSYGYRSFVDHPVQLQGALISRLPAPMPETLPQAHGDIEGSRWFTAQSDSYSVSLLGKTAEHPHHFDKGYHPLKVRWGDRTRVHSFVCQGGNMEVVSYEWHPDGYIGMEVLLGPLPHTEDKEKAREVIFYTEALEGVGIQVADGRSTTFQLGDPVRVSSAGLALQLTFELLEGSGSFVGHIMRGNRPAQMSLKGAHRLEAFDWQIFLRTVYRTSPCRIRVGISIQKEPQV